MVGWTEDQLKEYLGRKQKKPCALPLRPAPKQPVSQARVVVPTKKPQALNNMEAAFDLYLRQVSHSLVLAQQVKLRLADKTWYTPDFMVFSEDGVVRCYETKGFMRDDAAVKLKVAAEQYWFFKWFLVTRKPKKEGGWWHIKPINP